METETPKLARVTMSATYYQQMQRDLTEAAAMCNRCYSIIRGAEAGSHDDMRLALAMLDGALRDIRNKIEQYISPL